MAINHSAKREQFQRFLPVLLRKSRVAQIGEPLKFTDTQRCWRLNWFHGFLAFFWGLSVLLFVVGLVLCFLPTHEKTGAMCIMSSFFPAICAICVWCGEGYVSVRWIAVSRGLFICCAKDKHKFISWQQISQIETKVGEFWSYIRLVTESGVELLRQKEQNLEMLQFVNKLLDLVIAQPCRAVLLKLQSKLRRKVLYNHLFTNEQNTFMLLLVAPIIVPYLVVSSFSPLVIPNHDFGSIARILGLLTVTILWCGVVMWIYFHYKRRRTRFVDQLVDELDQEEQSTEILTSNTRSNEFGMPPRSISKRVWRNCLFTRSNELALVAIAVSVMLLIFCAIPFCMIESIKIRSGLLFFRWQSAGEGKVISIADSSTETAPNGNPAPSGEDIITVERNLSDGRIVQCKNPFRTGQGLYKIGQIVPIQQYANETDVLRIDDPNEQTSSLIFVAMVLVVVLLLAILDGFCIACLFGSRVLAVRLLETAKVKLFRIEKPRDNKQKQNKCLLVSIDGSEKIESEFCRGVREEVVSVFLNESDINQSVIAEHSLYSPLYFNSTNNEIDCQSERFYWGFIAGLIPAIAGLVVIVVRIVIIY
jgi:hypothetical protein